MAEGLALASSVAGLASLAIQLTQVSFQYVSDVRKASKAISSYLQELSVLTSVLLRLQDVVDMPDIRELLAVRPSTLSATAIRECRTELYHLKSKLEKRTSKDGLLGNLKVLTWPFEEKETRRTVDMLHRFREIFHAALSSDTLVVSTASYREIRNLREDENRRTILEWLSPADARKTQKEVFETHQAGTGQWLLHRPEFIEWLQGSRGLLWCYGDPGTGKTVMTSLVLDHITNLADPGRRAIAYHYCDYEYQKVETAEYLLRSLAKQVAAQIDVIPEDLLSLHKDAQTKSELPSLDALTGLLICLCRGFSGAFVVIDALDENLHKNKLVLILKKLEEAKIKVFITSRRLPELQEAFGKQVSLEIKAAASDVQNYVTSRFDEIDEFDAFTFGRIREEITEEIVQHANGMFLLARLILDNIISLTTVKEIRQALGRLPVDLTQVYQKTMIRISQQNPSRAKLAERVLGWVSFARRPLLIDELRHGLAVENDTSEMDVENLPSIKTILSVCIGLVVVDHQNDTVRLIHLTAREFFLKRGSKALLERTWEDMSRACLTYLSFKPLQSGPCNNSLALQTRMQALPFLEYAAQYWGEHVSHAESRIQKELMTFLNKSILMSSALEVLNSYPRRNTASADSAFGITPESLTILHVAAYWDLQTTTRLILKEETGKAMIPVPDSSGWTPFHWAASNGHVGMVKLLIDHRANLEILDNHGWTPLFWAVSKGHMEVVKILLESGANVSHCDWLHMTPLDRARNKGSEMIELLLSYDSPTGDLNKYRVAHSPHRFWYAQS